MIIPKKTLEDAGYTDEKLKAKFYPADKSKRARKIQDLIDLISSRIREGMDRCIEDGPLYAAIDEAMQAPNFHTGLSLAKNLANMAEQSPAELYKLAQGWGIAHMISPVFDPVTGAASTDSGGRPVLKLDLPVFVDVMVPLVLGYTHAQWAALFAMVDDNPMFKFSPPVPTPKDKAKCDIITSWIDQVSHDMGYRADIRQCFLQALVYSWCITAPQEPYFRQKVGTGDKKTTEREGVRVGIPHPGQAFIDLAHRPSTINSDNGCAYLGWWTTCRYGEMAADKTLWSYNDDGNISVSKGIPSIMAGSKWKAYQALYPCRLTFPTKGYTANQTTDNREERAFEYTRNEFDNGIVRTISYHKLVPKDWDLFDYDEPVWFRWDMAFDSEPLKVEPMNYTPGAAFLFNYDQSRSVGSSFSHQMIPFQDGVRNLLIEYTLAVKRNLTNLVFYNMNGVDPAVIEKLQALGSKFYTQLNLQGVDGRALETQGLKVGSLFERVDFPVAGTAEILNGVNVLLSVMERTLGISSHDVGAQGSHQQSAAEVARMGAGSSSRRRFTLGLLEDGMDRFQTMIYEAQMVHGSDEVVAHVADTLGIDPQMVAELGFKVEAGDSATRSYGVVGNKTSLSMSRFATSQQGARRTSDAMLAEQMLKTMQIVFNSPELIRTAGVEKIVDWWNTVATYAGLPTNMRLRADPNAQGPGANPEEMQAQMVQIAQKVAEEITSQQLAQLGEAMRSEVLDPMKAEMGEAIATLAKRMSRVEGAAQLPPSPDAIPA